MSVDTELNRVFTALRTITPAVPVYSRRTIPRVDGAPQPPSDPEYFVVRLISNTGSIDFDGNSTNQIRVGIEAWTQLEHRAAQLVAVARSVIEPLEFEYRSERPVPSGDEYTGIAAEFTITHA